MQLANVPMMDLKKEAIQRGLATPVFTPDCVDAACWREFNVFKVFLWKYDHAELPQNDTVRSIDVRGFRAEWMSTLTYDDIRRMNFHDGAWSDDCVAALSLDQVYAIPELQSIELPFTYAPDVVSSMDEDTFRRLVQGYNSAKSPLDFDCSTVKAVTYNQLSDCSWASDCSEPLDKLYADCSLTKPQAPTPGPAPAPGPIPGYHGPTEGLSAMGIVGIVIACLGAVGLAVFFFVANRRFNNRGRVTEDDRQYAALS
eukprot:GFYU01009967.1.p1 GENE.GFYU01009967.1~~GFYU01009967.1.p1  ORF type:complete len:287 (+),score=61.17 GFYU01009967.1:95-862(+)